MVLTSVGNIDERTYDGTIPGDNVKVIHFHQITRYASAFTVPTFLWWMSFIATAGEFVTDGAASYWFFSKD
jgi:hypothetical protein